jgi:hypothetical protein
VRLGQSWTEQLCVALIGMERRERPRREAFLVGLTGHGQVNDLQRNEFGRPILPRRPCHREESPSQTG